VCASVSKQCMRPDAKLTSEDSIELELVVDILLLDLGVRRNVDGRRRRHDELGWLWSFCGYLEVLEEKMRMMRMEASRNRHSGGINKSNVAGIVEGGILSCKEKTWN
jgi:hypothetical protein